MVRCRVSGSASQTRSTSGARVHLRALRRSLSPTVGVPAFVVRQPALPTGAVVAAAAPALRAADDAARNAPADRLAQLQHAPGSCGRAHRVRHNPGQPTSNTGALTGHTRRCCRARGAPMHHDVIRLCPRLPPGQTPAEDLHGIGPVGPARGRQCGWYACWRPGRCEALVVELTEPHEARRRVVRLKRLRLRIRTHAGGTRALPARPPGPLSCHTGPEPSVLGVGPLRHGQATSGDHLWLRRTHDSKASGMSMPRRIAIFPCAVQNTARLHLSCRASAPLTSFPLGHPPLSASQPKQCGTDFQRCTHTELCVSSMRATITPCQEARAAVLMGLRSIYSGL